MRGLELLIQIDDMGRVRVQGPIENKILCFGVLEVAKEAVIEHHHRQQENRIEPANVIPSNLGPKFP